MKKEGETVGAWGKHRGNEKCLFGFGWEYEGKNHLEDLA
jgi:hypothetical protein